MNKGLFAVLCAAAGVAIGVTVHVVTGPASLGPERVAASTNPARVTAGALELPVQSEGAATRAEAGADPTRPESAGYAPARLDPVRHSAIDLKAPVLSYNDGIMRAAPAVVSLYAGQRETIAGGGNGGGPVPRVSQGSGVIVDPDGIVLTNLHLVADADAINVVLDDGQLHVGKVIGSDSATDLAVVRIDPAGIPEGGFPAMPLDDAPPLRVGDIVLAIGNPYGVGQTVTQGIVSATGRRVAGGGPGQNLVQIDAAINPGNSGGALINPAGQLVGVTAAVFRRITINRDGQDSSPDGSVPSGGSAQGIGYAIPAELLAQVVPEIITGGQVTRGWMGVSVDDLPRYPELHRRYSRGAVITDVQSGSPAERGGLRESDVVTAVDDRPIHDAGELLMLIASLAPGTAVPLIVERDEQQLVLQIRLGAHTMGGE